MEKPDSEKLSHAAVDYERPASPAHRNEGKVCANCKHFIHANPPRCEGVKSPIRAQDFCKRFKRKARMAKHFAGGTKHEKTLDAGRL